MKNHTNPSQTVKILNYLLKGKSITPLEALSRFKCFRLASRINEIKRSGIIVNKEIVTKNGKRYARYSLGQKIKATAAALLITCGIVNAQETVNYSGYSYSTGYGNTSPNYYSGTATISRSRSTSDETRAIVDRMNADSQRRLEESYRQLDASRQRTDMQYQTELLEKQTKLLKKIANQ
jgi:hypothetical protein